MPTKTTTFQPDVTARLHILPVADFRFMVAVADDPAHAVPDLTPARVSALLTHDDGLTKPNARGWALALALAVVEKGGTAMCAFDTLADALAFRARVTGGGQ